MHKHHHSAEAMDLDIKNSDQQYPGTHLASCYYVETRVILEYILRESM
jgi:hypothetical protein